VARSAGEAQAAAGVADDGLTSFGATMAAWNAHHRSGAAYSNVTPQGGRVVEYTISTGTLAVDAAIKRVKHELPGDSRQIWSAQKGNCYQVELTSATVGRALAAGAIGDSSGGVLAMISTLLPNGSTDYRPDGVNQIMLSPGAYPAATDAPDC
jgi:hypothetical protein